MAKKTILIDFDKTLNSYTSGWKGDPWNLPDPPVPGAVAFIRRMIASSSYDPVIFTTRALNKRTMDVEPRVEKAIRAWFVKHGLEPGAAATLRTTCHKIPCSLIIDDKAFRFEGKYPTTEQLGELTK